MPSRSEVKSVNWHKLNWMENMRSLIKTLKPDRLKIFQVLHIVGQNDCYFVDLSISDEQFNYFKSMNGEMISGF
jgi:predicted metalloendopeptidase